MRRFFIAAVVAASLAACAQTTGQPTTGPAILTAPVPTGIVAVEQTLTLADNSAREYTNLQRCGTPGATVICSDPAIVLRIRKAAIRAHKAMVAARNNQALISFAVDAAQAFSAAVPTH